MILPSLWNWKVSESQVSTQLCSSLLQVQGWLCVSLRTPECREQRPWPGRVESMRVCLYPYLCVLWETPNHPSKKPVSFLPASFTSRSIPLSSSFLGPLPIVFVLSSIHHTSPSQFFGAQVVFLHDPSAGLNRCYLNVNDRSELGHAFCKGPGDEYFTPCSPYSHSHSILPLCHKNSHRRL